MDRCEAKRSQIRLSLAEAQAAGGFPSLTVAQVMTLAPCCVRPHVSVLDLVRLICDMQFRHLLVTDDDDRLVGLISDRDVVRCFGNHDQPNGQDLAGIRASQIMSTDVVMVEPETPLAKAVELLLTHGISCLPVMVDGEVTGIVTNTDLQQLLAEVLQSSELTATTHS